MLSARNQFQGVVKSVKIGNVMAEVIVAVSLFSFWRFPCSSCGLAVRIRTR